MQFNDNLIGIYRFYVLTKNYLFENYHLELQHVVVANDIFSIVSKQTFNY